VPLVPEPDDPEPLPLVPEFPEEPPELLEPP
jgi:hypothetical protein